MGYKSTHNLSAIRIESRLLKALQIHAKAKDMPMYELASKIIENWLLSEPDPLKFNIQESIKK